MVNQLFTEKFRPKTLKDIILPERIRKELGDGELHQNYLFYSSPGTGKTSLAKIMAGDHPTLYINVSDRSSVDTIRTEITDFCGSISVLGGKEHMKVVILDEMDGASDQFYKALRATVEKFHDTARFIGTCNYITKVPDAIQSRFNCISFDYASQDEEKKVMIEYIKRVLTIFKAYGIAIEQAAAIEFVKRNFPDMRSLMNKMQSFQLKGITEIKIEDIKTLNYTYNDIFDLILNDPNPAENYKTIVGQYSSKVDDVLASLGTEFPSYIREHKPAQIAKLPQLIIEIAAHQAQRVHVIDPVITLLSCCFKLQQILSK
ncbi:MAG: AAA family ATPase [Candidatus Pacearchaeota archaeon]|jgi:replication factor C small subunit